MNFFHRFSYKLNEFMIEKFAKDKTLTLKHLLEHLDPQFLGNTPDWRNLHPKKTEKDVIFF